MPSSKPCSVELSSTALHQKAYDELCCYTLMHGGANFIHQHVVDAYAAQTATIVDKPIKIVFALVGLLLHLDRGFTGRQVQIAHMKLARRRQVWPHIELPADRGKVTAADVLASEAGSDRELAIDRWCQDVWNAFSSQKAAIENLLSENGVIPAEE